MNDCSNRNSEENLNLMTNLKYIFYYEMSLKSSQNFQKSSYFYDSLSYDCTIILKFFKNKFSILSSIFFSNESLIENILQNLNTVEMDIYYENYIKVYAKDTEIDNIKLEGKNGIHLKTKIEILNTLSFLINSFNDYDIVSQDIIKFILDLFDCLVKKSEETIILEHIQSLVKLILRLYKKHYNTIHQELKHQIRSSPIKIIFNDLVKHILSNILISSEENNSNKIYFDYFKEIHAFLKQENELIKCLIAYKIKELVNQNVDNQSFKNPITMYYFLT
jgi:hypothetical protein